MINYFYDCYTILNKVYSDGAFVKQAINSSLIEEKNRALTIKTVYGVLDKDIELSYILKRIADKSPKLAIRTILKISMYAIKYLKKKEYAVVQNAVELTKKLGKSGASGFVNAFLRKFINSTIELPKDTVEYLSIKYSWPEFAVRSLLSTYGRERTEKIISVENTKNYLFFPNGNGEKYLTAKNATYSSTVFDKLFAVENFVRDKGYDLGEYTYQALGSYAICDEVEPCDLLLDCCAAPGGKSINLSYKCKNVISWDIHEHRVGLINDYKSRMNRDNISASLVDAKSYISEFVDSFDAVLCDAPCSGLGVLNENPDIKLNRRESDIAELNKEQLAILHSVCKYVKVGGYLYYSTCSILSEENINIIKKFLDSNDSFEICPINSKLTHQDVLGTNAFLPDVSQGAGFYLAKLKRLK